MEEERSLNFELEGRECPECEGTGRIPEGAELAAMRRALGISQGEMAKHIGVASASYVSILETNKRKFNAKTLEKYLETLENKAFEKLEEKAATAPTVIYEGEAE